MATTRRQFCRELGWASLVVWLGAEIALGDGSVLAFDDLPYRIAIER